LEAPAVCRLLLLWNLSTATSPIPLSFPGRRPGYIGIRSIGSGVSISISVVIRIVVAVARRRFQKKEVYR
jgi:hypothetical protein